MRKHKDAPWTGDQPPPRSEWPNCAQCGRPLRPYIIREWGKVNEGVIGQRWSGHYDGYGHFCTMRCATRYANDVIDNRHRRK